MPDPGKRFLFMGLAAVLACVAILTALEIPERAASVDGSRLENVTGRIARAEKPAFRLEGDPTEYRIPAGVTCDCAALWDGGGAGKTALLQVVRAGAAADVHDLALDGEVLVSRDFGRLMGGVSAVSLAVMAGSCAALAWFLFLRARRERPL